MDKAREKEMVLVCQAAHRVADIIFSYASNRFGGTKPFLVDWRKGDSNPYHHQTKTGLFLEVANGQPRILWTPWGEWEFARAGSGSWENLLPTILKRLGAIEQDPMVYIDDKAEGPVYALNAIDGQPLPIPVLLKRPPTIDFEGTVGSWRKFCRKKEKR